MLARHGLIIDKKTLEKTPITFKIEQPIEQDGGANFSCICEIEGIPDTRGEIWGLDSLQAVELGMQYLQVLFDSITESYEINFPDGTIMESLFTIQN